MLCMELGPHVSPLRLGVDVEDSDNSCVKIKER
jgi:hypothetical protein